MFNEKSKTMHSYIVPCYNEVSSIALCLDSIQQSIYETGCPSEIIVVDCGSDDGSLDIVRQYQVRLQHFPVESRSYSKAVNLGVSLALGDYVQIVDSDCALANEWMLQAIHYLEQHPNISAVSGTWVGSHEGSDITRQRVERTTMKRSLFFQALGGPHLFLRNIVSKYPMDESLEGSADVDQIIRLKGAGYQTARLTTPMLVQIKPENTSISTMIKTAFTRHGVGSGRGYRKAWGRSLRCLTWYHYAKKYHLFFSFTFFLLMVSLICLFVGTVTLALPLLVLIFTLYAIILIVSYCLSRTWTGAFQMIILKMISALGFCWGLIKK